MEVAEGAKTTMLDTVTRELPVLLGEAEIARIGRQLGAAIEDLASEEAEQQEQRAKMKERLATIINRQRKLAALLAKGQEPRPVEVDIIADYEAGTAIECRRDTGEVLRTRALLDSERQMPLTPEVAEAAAEAMVEHSQTVGPEA